MKFAIYTFFLCISFCAFSQSPAGVDGCSIWLKTDKNNLEQSNNLFNYNYVVNKSAQAVYKNKIADVYSLFLVFKSDASNKLTVLSLKRGNSNTVITNEAVESSENNNIKKISSKNGTLLSYISSATGGKKNNLISFEKLFLKDEPDNQVSEFIFYPRALSTYERQRVETYLSIKFGISLTDGGLYINSEGKNIWNNSKSEIFSHRVTGIGRDDKLGLYQKQSGNAEKDGIYMGLDGIEISNYLNKSELSDKSFLLWGDNGEDTEFKKGKDTYIRTISRIWKVKPLNINSGIAKKIQLKVHKQEIGFNVISPPVTIKLALNRHPGSAFDYGNAEYIEPSFEDEHFLYYDEITWDEDLSGQDIFTFVSGPSSFAVVSSAINCRTFLPGIVNVSVKGGKPPYTFNISSDTGYKLTRESYNELNHFNELPEGEYDVSIKDADENKYSLYTSIRTLVNNTVSLQKDWFLNSFGTVTVIPDILENSLYSLEWRKGDTILSTDEYVLLSEPGNYELTVKNSSGCQKQFPFNVLSKIHDKVVVHPNPVKKASPFNIEIHLEQEANVILRLNSIEGKSIFTRTLGLIKDYKTQESLLTSGVYILRVTTGEKDYPVKILVTE